MKWAVPDGVLILFSQGSISGSLTGHWNSQFHSVIMEHSLFGVNRSWLGKPVFLSLLGSSEGCVCARVRLFVTPWIITHQAPLSMGFFRQEYWSGLPLPPPRDLPILGIKPTSPMSPALAGRFFNTEPPGKPSNEAAPLSCLNFTGFNRKYASYQEPGKSKAEKKKKSTDTTAGWQEMLKESYKNFKVVIIKMPLKQL